MPYPFLPANSSANPFIGSAYSVYGIRPKAATITFSVGIAAASANEYVTKTSGGSMPTATIQNGLLTFSFPQTHPYIGVGDKVELDDGSPFYVYLNEKINTRQWRVHNAVGDIPTDKVNLPVTTIDKTFNDVRSAINGDISGAYNLIGTHDLISKFATLRIACYDMYDDMGANTLSISNLWVVNNDYRVKVYTPINISTECNKKQRHINGRSDLGGYRIASSSYVINMFGTHNIIEGLIIGDDGYTPGCGVMIYSDNNYTQILDNVIFKMTKGIEVDTPEADSFVIANNVVRDCGHGIILNEAQAIGGACFNNFVKDCQFNGIMFSDNIRHQIYNNTIQDGSITSGLDINDYSAGYSNVKNCITKDGSATATGINCITATLKLEDIINKDFRPHISDTVAYTGGAGLDLSSDDMYGFIHDINGEEIDDTWCIGPFHKTPEVSYSIGPAGDIKSGSPTYSVVDAIMTFSAAQTDELLTAGCIVNDVGTSHLLKRKISDTEWEVTQTDGAIPPNAAGPVTITTIQHNDTNIANILTDTSAGRYLVNQLGTIDLVSADMNVKIVCAAGISSRSVELTGYNCDRHRHVNIFAPDLSNADYIESNNNRRHNGKWGELSYISSSTDFPVNQPYEIYGDRGGYSVVLNSGADFCSIKGVQLSSSIDGVLIDGAKNVTVVDNIVKGCKGNGITVTGKEKSNENLIAKNIIYKCGGNGIEIQHGAAFETYYEAKYGTPAINGFIITSMFGHTHIFKKYTVTVVAGSVDMIEWFPGRVVITADSGSSIGDILASGNIFGTPWGTITTDGASAVDALSEIRMEDAVTLLEYHEADLGIKHYLYSNTITKCQCGIYIEALVEQDWATNIAVMRNNNVFECGLDNYYSTHVFPITILAENNWSDDQSILNFYGSNNIDTLTPRFINASAEDYRATLYDLERMEGINLASDENFQIECDNVGTEYAIYQRWAIGANTWKFRKKSIHCSVGLDSGNLDDFPANRTITIENGIAEFSSSDISGGVGVGDKVQYDDGGSAYCYLAEKGTEHRWCVVDDSGNQITSLTTKDVTDITRVSNSLEDAFSTDITDEFSDISDKDIAADMLDLYVWGYNDDIDDVTEVIIDTWLTTPFYRLYIQAPWDIRTQCMSRQMHTGKWDGYRVVSDDEPNGSSGVVVYIGSTDHIIIRGIGIEPPSVNGCGIVTDIGRKGVIVENNVVRNGRFGIWIRGAVSGGNVAYGNILYDQSDTNIEIDGGDAINNTAIGTSTNGIIVTSAADKNINNICQDQTTCFGGSATPRTCISSDGTAGTDNECMSNVTLNFVDKTGKDFHLHKSDWHALNRGIKFSSIFPFRYVSGAYVKYSFYRDIDNELIKDDGWSIGADSFIEMETIDLYFSASQDTTSFAKGASPYLEIEDGVMTFSEPQDDEAMGIGDKVDYDVDNKICYLYSKTSDTVWEVRDKFGIAPPNTSGPTDLNTINRAFTNNTLYLFDQTESGSVQQLIGDSNNPFLHLRTARYRLNIALYKYTTEHSYTTIRYFDTDGNNCLRLYTPRDERNECNISQAHNGEFSTANPRAWIRTLGANHAISLYVNHTTIDGLSISGDHSVNMDSIRLRKANNCKIVNNFLWLGENGIKPNDMGHDDFTGDHFLGTIRTDIWDTSFYSNWELRNVPGIGYVAIPEWLQVGVISDLTSGADKSGDFDYEFGMVLGSDNSVGQKLRFILDDGAIKAECNWEDGALDFGGSQLNFPWKLNHEYKVRIVRGGTITSDGLYVDDAGEDSTTSLYYLDDFNDGDGNGSGKWVKHPGTYTLWSGDHHIEVEGPKAHGFSYIDLWVASEPLPGGTKITGKNSNNIIINNTVADVPSDGIVTSNTDILYNNTVDECGGYCYRNEASDLLINNIGQRGVAGVYYNGDTAEFCVADDASLTVIGENRNINNYTLTFVDKTGSASDRDYHLALATDDLAIWSAKHLIGNIDYPFNIDGGGIPRHRKWDRGSLEYQSKKVIYAIGDVDVDHQTKPGIGGLTYIINEINGKSYIDFYIPQTKLSMGVGSQVIDVGNPFPNGCLIIEKITETKWIVVDYVGNSIADRFGSVFNIKRVFNTLYEALDSSGVVSSTYLDSSSFYTAGVYVELVCYNEGIGRAIQTALNVDSIGFDKHHNLRIQVPQNIITECNISQRHDGLYDEGFKFEPEEFNNSAAAMYFFQASYLEIEGMLLTADNTIKNGIHLFDCKDAHIGYNVIKNCGGNGILLEQATNPEDVIFNNLVYDCGRDGIVVRANFNPFFSILTRVNNNTVVNCRRAFYLEKADEEYAGGLSVELRNNIAQDSLYQDYVSTYENHFGRFALYNCISSDFSSWLFPGTGNIRGQYVRFIGRPDNFNLHKIQDGFAIDDAIDLSTDWLYSFFDDIGGRERDPGDYDRGAFEVVDVIGSGNLITGPVEMIGKGFEGTDYPLLVLYLREPGNPPETPLNVNFLSHINPLYQFIRIEGSDEDWDINAFLALLPTTDNVIIYVHGGKLFEGTFELQDRNPRTVTIKTYPPEAYLGPASHIYLGPIADDASDQALLMYDGMKVYSESAAAQDYLLNNTAATKVLRFINSIVQVNKDSVIDNITDAIVQVTNSIIVYRNG